MGKKPGLDLIKKELEFTRTTNSIFSQAIKNEFTIFKIK